MPAFFAFLHHAAAFALVSGIVVEWLLMRDPLTPQSVRRLARADAIVGLAAVGLLVIGSLRVMSFEKGAPYYMHNAAFLSKFVLFIAIALISIVPTMRFLRWNRAVRAGQPIDASPADVSRVRRLLHLELAGVVFILLFAALMARGVGMVG